MKIRTVALSLVLAIGSGALALEQGSARLRDARLELERAKNTEEVKAPGTTYTDEAAHENNKDSRHQEWSSANQEQKAAVYDVAKNQNEQKQANKEQAGAASQERATTRQSDEANASAASQERTSTRQSYASKASAAESEHPEGRKLRR